jgi:hypothetical protein
MKKPFKDTKFAAFLQKAKAIVPDVAGVALEVATGDIPGAIDKVGDMLRKNKGNSPEAKALTVEFDRYRMEWIREMAEIELRDRESAREREVAMAQSGRPDVMFWATGAAVIAAFLVCVYSVIFLQIPEANKELFSHLMGMIEGAFIGGMVMYYFGSSKSSSEKNKWLGKQ